ncbi:MAG TPA: hypothetical protein DEA96_00020 [Leptospiraceae bacterium]|nr:hypothetical protein [Spirochaetaceae bacterium]HBS03318.1 hypothetical protein [Leptospiraceae bacterium]
MRALSSWVLKIRFRAPLHSLFVGAPRKHSRINGGKQSRQRKALRSSDDEIPDGDWLDAEGAI